MLNELIPKIIHITWKTKDIENCDIEMLRLGFLTMKSLNPDWEVVVSDDEDLDNYLSRSMSAFDYAQIANEHPVVKSDVWRLYKLYNEGGLYIDLDRLWNVSLSSIITSDAKWVLPTCLDVDFSHDFMCSAPNNPAFATAIEMQSYRRKQGHKSVYYLGPQTYMHAVTQTLTGTIIDSNPGPEIFDNLRHIMAEMPFISTYREFPPQDTIVFRNSIPFDHESMKKDMYKEFNIKHWTGEW